MSSSAYNRNLRQRAWRLRQGEEERAGVVRPAPVDEPPVRLPPRLDARLTELVDANWPGVLSVHRLPMGGAEVRGGTVSIMSLARCLHISDILAHQGLLRLSPRQLFYLENEVGFS